MMAQFYPAVIHKKGPTFEIEFPDLPDCKAYGATLCEVLEESQEALGLHLASLDEDCQEFPVPSKISDIDASDGQVTYITTDMNRYKKDTRAVRKTISIPAWMAKEAEASNLSLSKILQDALKQYIEG